MDANMGIKAAGQGAEPPPSVPFRVFFIPFFVPSHMIPMADLARQFAACGVHSTMVVTPANAAALRPAVDGAARGGHPIHILTYPFPSAEVGLPEGIESLATVPPDEADKIYRAVDAVRPAHDRVLREHRPDAVVADIPYWWTTDIARDLGIPRVTFFPIGAFPLVVMSSLYRNRPHADLADGDNGPFPVPGLPDRIEMVKSELPNFLRVRDHHAENEDRLKKAQRECFGVVLNTFYELEPAYCDQFRREECRQAWFVGPYSLWHRKHEEEETAVESSLTATGGRCMAWLETRATASVVFVCFGSFNYFTKEQHWEMARGLEAAGRPFLWVLKGNEFAGGGADWLPEGFEERLNGRGLVVRGWVPQVDILRHRATGAFVSHLGWSSLTEGLAAGKPMITWPLAYEQFINERLVVNELRVGVRMWDGHRSSLPGEAAELVVPGDAIAAVVARFAPPGSADEEVEGIRKRAGEWATQAWAAVAYGGSSSGDLGRLIDELKAFRVVK